jgi:hypothetical protein
MRVDPSAIRPPATKPQSAQPKLPVEKAVKPQEAKAVAQSKKIDSRS